MIKKITEKYCDLCGKEVKHFHSTVQFFDYAIPSVTGEIDICKKCEKKFWKTFKKMRKELDYQQDNIKKLRQKTFRGQI